MLRTDTGEVIVPLHRARPHNQKLLLSSASRNVTATRFALEISRQHLNLAEIGRGR